MFPITRRGALTSAAGASLAPVLAACAGAAAQEEAASRVRLVSRPGRVFKAADLPREGTEAWFTLLIAETAAPAQLEPTRVSLSYFAGADECARGEIWGAALPALTIRDLSAPEGAFWPFGLRLISRQPAAANIDRMRVTVAFDAAPAASLDIAVATYAQQADLVFPFRGNGIVTQAGAANGGHRNASGQFAIDAMGLGGNYAVQTGEAFARNTDLTGFGRELIAPGGGLVVHARGDRPDQPVPGESNPDYHVPELRGAGDPGNHVVIDHGGGEFSMVAHLMAGSLAVREGERVAQGQRIGRLGNSGDSFAPHVHHQMQDGPDWRSANALPHRYRNVEGRLDRGTFFAAS